MPPSVPSSSSFPPQAPNAPPIASSFSLSSLAHPSRIKQLYLESRQRARVDRTSWDYIMRTGFAGGLAGCVAKTAVAPLDRVKILFQTSNKDFQKFAGTFVGVAYAAREIYRTSGLRGLFQGHSATLLRVFPYAGIKFVAYDQLAFILMPTRESETKWKRFVAGAGSGVMSVLCTYPLELIRVRLAYTTRLTGNHALWHTIRTIYREGEAPSTTFSSPPSASPTPSGAATATATSSAKTIRIIPKGSLFALFPLFKFYRGFTVTLTGMIPYAGTSFLMYGTLHRALQASGIPEEQLRRHKPFADLSIGAVAGAVSQTASYPFEVIRRRMQVGGVAHPERWLRWGETVQAIWSSRGWKGFFVGLSIGYVKVVPMTAISFATWEWGKRMLL
ncbi:mitochondrial carrier [Dacryopinax primogenitus]|uniref:Mitochondrial carrier n=1 Tax=Dacryopinax primogenitus (strain DJM 731) TaxID=1858805 RepID=M5GDT9_DACPD|nr:mitochondrial carrier [Dacryopinax primogenitus]EJU04827.1 mitochondrial carrier [Dacryopinax primogenitus]